MNYKLIEGTFHIVSEKCSGSGPEPDGDTIKFLPTQPLLVESLYRENSGSCPGYNTSGQINIRFEGIDALETHFEYKHQDLKWAKAARDRMLELAGYTNVVYCPQNDYRIKSADKDGIPGHILTNGMDGHGRIVAFVYAGKASEPDGSDITMTDALLNKSINTKLLEEGLVYPAFYKSLPELLRTILAGKALSAQNNDKGLWPEASCLDGRAAVITDLAELQKLVIWPKLFRRLVSYFSSGYSGLGNFSEWITEKKFRKDRNDFLMMADGSICNMSDIIEVHGDTVRLLNDPDEFTIVPDDMPPEGNETADESAPRKIIKILAAMPAPMKTGKETVSIANMTPFKISIAGWTLSDLKGGTDKLSGNIRSGEILQIEVNKVTLNNDGDTIYLNDMNGKLIDSAKYYAGQAGRTGRIILFSQG